MNVVKMLTKNILLMIAGFIACLTGNFFFGLLIGLGAGVLQCTFSGGMKGKPIKDALIGTIPVAVVVGVLCGVGGMFAGGLHTFGGWLIAIVVTLLCAVVGAFMAQTKYVKDQNGELPEQQQGHASVQQAQDAVQAQRQAVQAVMNGQAAPISQASQTMLDNLRGTSAQAQEPEEPKEPDDYDDMIDTSKGDQDYYGLVMKLTGKRVVTKRIIDEAYEKLPRDVREKYKHDPPLVTLTSYAYELRAQEEAKKEDTPYCNTVRELSGEQVVNEQTVDKAYNALPEETRQDLPKDQPAAIMMHAVGTTIPEVQKKEDDLFARAAEQREALDNARYEAIPEILRERLPTSKGDAADNYEGFYFNEFYDSLDMRLQSRVPKELIYSTIPAEHVKTGDRAEEYLWTHREEVLDEFDKDLQSPLCDIPIGSLMLLLPPKEQIAGPHKVCKKNEKFLASLFNNSLGEPLRRIPIKTMWLSLPLKDRKHPKSMLADIKANFEYLVEKFQGYPDYHCPRESMFLPNDVLQSNSLCAMYEKIRPMCDESQSILYNILMNIDKCKESALGAAVTIHPLIRIAPFDMFKYMMEWSLGFDEDDMNPGEYYSKYIGQQASLFAGDTVPAPLDKIPMFMLWFFKEDMELLNSDNKVASMSEEVLNDPDFYVNQFEGTHGTLRSYIPKCCVDAWTEDELNATDRRVGNDDFTDEVWRLWLPPCLAELDLSDLQNMCHDVPKDRNPSVMDILMHAKSIRAELGK